MIQMFSCELNVESLSNWHIVMDTFMQCKCWIWINKIASLASKNAPDRKLIMIYWCYVFGVRYPLACRLFKCVLSTIEYSLYCSRLAVALYLGHALASSSLSPYMENIMHTHYAYICRNIHHARVSDTRRTARALNLQRKKTCPKKFVQWRSAKRQLMLWIWPKLEWQKNRIALTATYCHRFGNIAKFAYFGCVGSFVPYPHRRQFTTHRRHFSCVVSTAGTMASRGRLLNFMANIEGACCMLNFSIFWREKKNLQIVIGFV